MKPLEALENIKSLFVGSSIDLSEQFEIIEKALTEEEICKEIEEYQENKKKLKALDIIVKKGVDVNMIRLNDYKDYSALTSAWLSMFILSKEEFDLIKEVVEEYDY